MMEPSVQDNPIEDGINQEERESISFHGSGELPKKKQRLLPRKADYRQRAVSSSMPKETPSTDCPLRFISYKLSR